MEPVKGLELSDVSAKAADTGSTKPKRSECGPKMQSGPNCQPCNGRHVEWDGRGKRRSRWEKVEWPEDVRNL